MVLVPGYMWCTYPECKRHNIPESTDKRCEFHTETGKIKTFLEGKPIFFTPDERNNESNKIATEITNRFIFSFEKLISEYYSLNKDKKESPLSEALDVRGFIFPNLTYEEWLNIWGPLVKIEKYKIFLNIPFAINFSDAKFGGEISFNDAKFSHMVDFNLAHFSKITNFRNAIFSDSVNFFAAHFSEPVDFFCAKFMKKVSFMHAQFDSKANFNLSRFYKEIGFFKTHFNGKISFKTSIFFELGIFEESEFREEVDFIDTIAKKIDFSGCNIYSRFRFCELQKFIFSRILSLKDSQAMLEEILPDLKDMQISYKDSTKKDCEITPPPYLIFKDLRFWDNGHIILEDFDVSNTSFWQSNLYIIRPRVDFIRVNWGSNKQIYDDNEENLKEKPEEVERIYKQIRLIYEARGDYPDAGDFYLHEMAARKIRLKPHYLLQIKEKRIKGLIDALRDDFLYTFHDLYGLISKYGESPALAFVWLQVLILIIGPILLCSFGVYTLANKPYQYSNALSVVFQAVTLGRSELYQPTNFWGIITFTLIRIIGLSIIAMFLLALKRRFRR
jgi:hypothetical protein